MTGHVASLDLRTRRKSLVGYSLGMAAYVVIVVALYPAFKNSTELNQFTENGSTVAALFGISGSLTSPAGWVNANIYANFFPLIMLLLTIGYGGAALAGQERDGHLELILALPLTRRRIVSEKIAALVVQAIAFSIVVLLSVLLGRTFGLTLDSWHLVTATAGVTLLGIDLGLLTLAIGGATGNRGHALGIASSIAGAAYLISSMAPLVDWLRPAKYASPFYWAVGDNQLKTGLSIGSAAVLVGSALVLALAAIATFERHDLS